MDIRETKNELRREYLGKRRAIPAEERAKADREICRALLECELFQKTQTLLVYAPKEPEVDIFPLIDSALSMGKRVAFPRCGRGYSLSFHYAAPNELILDHFGILEPTEDMPLCQALSDSLCLVPALLFDQDGFRLGYGKGYYDRFLASYHGKTVGIAREGFILSKLPRGPFDLAVDMLVSETGVRFLS